MKNFFHLLQINLNLYDFKFTLLSFITAFVVTMICIPFLITLLKKYSIYDFPGARKSHFSPVPSMGGIAIIGGMMMALILWFPFTKEAKEICFFLSIILLLALGIMDDLKDLSARYKFMVQLGLASLMAVSGLRITSFNGLFGIQELSLAAQYTITVTAIVGVTNAFNLIDGIDGLAGGLGFMSLVTAGIFLGMSGDMNMALIAFTLAGALLAFLYFNFNPAKIFMGDTGSLVLGFVIAVLCVRLMQINAFATHPVIHNVPVFVLGIVLIPVFDTLRVFAIRIWRGKSPFTADKTHIHHLLIHAGASHSQTTRVICCLHGFILIETFWLRELKQEIVLAFLLLFMILATLLFRHAGAIFRKTGSFRLFSFLKGKDII